MAGEAGVSESKGSPRGSVVAHCSRWDHVVPFASRGLMSRQGPRRQGTRRGLLGALTTCCVLLALASPANGEIAALLAPDTTAPTVKDVTTPPSPQDLAHQDPVYQSVENQAEQSIDSSTSDDVTSEVQDDPYEESEVEKAFKECLLSALAAAVRAAGENANIPAAFVSEAESCIDSQLGNLEPTTGAIQQAAAYLQADVAGAVAAEQPEPTSTTTTASPNPKPSGSSFPWWGWGLIAVGVIGLGSFLKK